MWTEGQREMERGYNRERELSFIVFSLRFRWKAEDDIEGEPFASVPLRCSPLKNKLNEVDGTKRRRNLVTLSLLFVFVFLSSVVCQAGVVESISLQVSSQRKRKITKGKNNRGWRRGSFFVLRLESLSLPPSLSLLLSLSLSLSRHTFLLPISQFCTSQPLFAFLRALRSFLP